MNVNFINKIIQSSQGHCRGGPDAAVISLHSAMLSQGFLAVERDDEKQCRATSSLALPNGWNEWTDVFKMNYCFGVFSDIVFELRILAHGNKVITHALSPSMPEGERNGGDAGEGGDLLITHESDTKMLVSENGQVQVDKLLDSVKKMIEVIAQPLRKKHSVISEEPPSSKKDERPPTGKSLLGRDAYAQRENRPNFVVPPMYPPGGSARQDHFTSPLSVGHNDLNPLGGFSPGGGMFMDFNHPLFQDRQSRPPMGGMGGGAHLPPPQPGFLPAGAVPAGARFDPIVPQGLGGGLNNPSRSNPSRRGGPDPDHLPPPGYNDMFM